MRVYIVQSPSGHEVTTDIFTSRSDLLRSWSDTFGRNTILEAERFGRCDTDDGDTLIVQEVEMPKPLKPKHAILVHYEDEPTGVYTYESEEDLRDDLPSFIKECVDDPDEPMEHGALLATIQAIMNDPAGAEAESFGFTLEIVPVLS